MNPTFVGLVAVVVWGMSLPFVRILEAQIGISAIIGTIFLSCGLLGLISMRVRKQPFADKSVFKNPYLYGRWVFFVLHEAFIISAISIVQKEHIPFVILINYLWPTAIILCSILLAGVVITRWWAFIAGSIIVISSMAIELLGAGTVGAHLFENKTDVTAYLLAFFGAISWGLYCAISRRAGDETGSSSVVPYFQLTLGLALPLSFMDGLGSWQNLQLGAGLVLVGYCLCQFAAYLSWDYGMRKGNVVVLSLFADFIPWLSLFMAHLVIGVDIGTKTIFSAALLVIGAMVTRYGTLPPKAQPPLPPPHIID